MKLQGRKLSIRMRGEDVAWLLRELLQLGYQIPSDEQSKGYFGQGAQQAVLDLQKQHGLKTTGVVDAATVKIINAESEKARAKSVVGSYVVQGHVRDEDGKPISHIVIRAVDKDVHGENVLGEALTDEMGHYKIEYSDKQFRRSKKEKGGPDLVVYALDPGGAIISSSRKIDNAEKHETVDLTIKSEPGKTEKSPAVSVVNGKVASRVSAGVGGLRVEAWDKDLLVDDFVAEAITDEQGAFHLEFAANRFRELFFDREPDLFFRVYRDKGLIKSTEDSVLWNVKARDTEVVIEVDVEASKEPGKKTQPLTVRGQVRTADGRPLKGHLVRAFDKDLRNEELLGETKTDNAGRYEIGYSPERFRRAEKASADLIVRALDAQGTVVAESSILFNAEPQATVDLVAGGEAYRGPSEYDQLVETLSPLLDGLAFAELSEDGQHQDVSFLSGETGQDPQRITFLITAHHLLKETDVPAEAFYGMFRQGLPTQLPALLAQSPDVQRRAVVRSAQANIISLAFADKADTIVEQFKSLVVREAMKQPPDGGDERATLSDLLGVALPETQLREDFLNAYVSHSGPVEEFWKTLAAQPDFKERVQDVQRTLQLGALTGNHLPLVKELQRRQQAGEITALSDLTRFDENGWLKMITTDSGGGVIGAPPGVPGLDDAERARTYARAMSHLVEDAFPTTFVARRLEADNLPGRDDLWAFFNANAHFNLRSTRLGSYLRENPDALANVRDPEAAQIRIKSFQRVYKLAPRYEQASALLKGGVDSAHAITRMGENVFLSTYGDQIGGKGLAKIIYARAQQVQATAMSLLSEYGPLSYRIELGAFHGSPVPEVEGVPEWSTLFGSLELCDCEHCRSIYSPAAYLADVLHFLKDRPSKAVTSLFTITSTQALIDSLNQHAVPDAIRAQLTGKGYALTSPGVIYQRPNPNQEVTDWHIADHGRFYLVHKDNNSLNVSLLQSAKDVLFERRPDIGEVELTCENTNTPLPYVDLVNEVLENAVAPFAPFVPFNLPAGVEADLNQRTLSPNLRNAFIPRLSPEAVITVGGEGQPWNADPAWWTIDEPGLTYTIRKENNQLNVVARSLQTKGSAAERAANPQYINTSAYKEVLAKAVYPWSLPFGLWAEEARAYLGHLGVPRFLIMETFQAGERAAILSDAALAREHLGLTSAQADLITGATTKQDGAANPGLWNLWGFATQNLTAQDSVLEPSDSTRRIAEGVWLDVLRGRVDVFLHQSGLKYEELLDLLDTYYVNPPAGNARTIQIVSTDLDNPDTCETDKLQLKGFDEDAAARTVRFVRLWRALGWSMRDLDRAINAFPPAHLDGDLLTRLSHIQRLHTALNLPVLRLLSWWADLDTAFYIEHSAPGQPRAATLYDQLFRNRAVINPPDLDFEDPANLKGTLSGHATTITAAVSISAADFALLLNSADVIQTIPDPGDPEPDPNKKRQIPDDRLTLGYLTQLHRHTSLAKALRLSIRDYLIALKLSATKPFDSTTATLMFVEAIDKARDADFSFAELDYLLRHTFTPESAIAPSDEAIATFLDELRAGVQKIAEENTYRTDADDLNGDLTRQKLALLNWDRAVVDQAVATLNGAVAYEEPLAALPPGMILPNAPDLYAVGLAVLPVGFAIPAELRDIVAYNTKTNELTSTRFLSKAERDLLQAAAATVIDPALINAVALLFQEQDELQGEISFDAQRQLLRFAGPMTNARKSRLDAVSNDANYLRAVQALYDAPRRFISRVMRTFTVRDFSIELTALPADITIPNTFKRKVYFHTADPKTLHCLGVMTEQERDVLLGLSADVTDPNHAAYQAAINTLYDQVELLVPTGADAFLTATGAGNDAAAFFDTEVAPADHFSLVLGKLLPYLRRTLSERFVVQKMAEALQLEARSAELLLRTLASPADLQHNVALRRRCLAELLDPSFTESSANVRVASAAFPAQFKTFLRAHKVAMVAARFKLIHRQLDWLFTYGPDAGWLDLNTLPTSTDEPAASFDGWLRLIDLAKVRDGLPQGENVLDELLARATAVEVAAPDADKNVAKQAWFTAVTRWTQWTRADLESLLGAADNYQQTGQLNVTFPNDFLGERLLVRLVTAFGLLKRLGLSAQLVAGLATSDVTQDKARAVQQAVRARYDEAQWVTLAKPLRDALREKQRAALAAYLVAYLKLPLSQLETPHPTLQLNDNRPAVKELQQKLNAAGIALAVDGAFGPTTLNAVKAFQTASGLPANNGLVDDATWTALDQVRRGLRDANGLYAHFLLDVEMDPCMMTSRIKQAISSVQLFVQRCLMSLEPNVAASVEVDVKWREWKWMKNYRVKEASIKIFSYAENWIEPELRDDKSPFFVELESELMQDDLTLEKAEEAFRHYLEKLDQVARLEVVATYHQLEQDSVGNTTVDILHVFARTAGTPHVYFYRQRVDSAYWTAWERIDLDIEGDHLIPTVWNRRLMLFWPIFTEKADELNATFSGGNLSGTTPSKYWEIKLAWSERKQGTWANKRVSAQAFPQASQPKVHPDVPTCVFRTLLDDRNDLYVLMQSEGWFGDIEGEKVEVVAAFRFAGCHAEPAIVDASGNDVVQPITGTDFYYMFFREDGDRQLYLPAPTDTAALAKTPGTFRLLPYPDGSSMTQHPFFFQDDRHTFIVIPYEVQVPVWNWSDVNKVDPSAVIDLPKLYWKEARPIPDPIGPVIHAADPWVSEPSLPVMPDGSVTLPANFGASAVSGAAPAEAGQAGNVGQSPSLGASAASAPTVRAAEGAKVIPFSADLVQGDSLPVTGTAQVTAEEMKPPALVGTIGPVLHATMPGLGWYSYQTENRFLFQTFYHPYVCAFVRELNRTGVDGLLQRPLQLHPEEFAPLAPNNKPLPPLDFKTEYEPDKVSNPIVSNPYPKETLDFDQDDAYALYNWELFFHAPLLIADRLSKNQRFEDAQKWFHYIFDPTDTSSFDVPQRYWRTKPFHERARQGYERERIQYLLRLLAEGTDPQTKAQFTADENDDLVRFEKAVAAWRKDPFKPHLIARMRNTVYQKTVVMKYLDNLIAWGDQLFRRDTIESINEATQLYILAAEILGRRPEDVPPRASPRVQTYNSLEPKLDDFSNALVQSEEFVSPSASGSAAVASGQQPSLPLPTMLYFCVPKNDKLLAYWDVVADRLFKIRHCMNIEGVVRQLPLFERPIEPGLLVRAAAAGVDFSSVLNDVNAALPHYRFNVLAQKATELCGELKALGSAMLSALEKRDAEKLSLIRAQQETALLTLVEEVKKLQVKEAEQNKAALRKSRDTAVTRYIHYQKLLGVQSPQVPGEGQPIPEAVPSPHVSTQEEGGVKIIPFEQQEMQMLEMSHLFQQLSSGLELAANIAHLIPDSDIEPWGVGVTYGGTNVGQALSAYASYLRMSSAQFGHEANRAGKMAQYALRAHDWLLQSNLAAREIMQIDQQILAADLRQQITDKELANHRRQIANAREVEDFLRAKYTNQELYGWMIGQLATVYFQAYQLAYDLAKRAERSFRHELGLRDSNYIQFGYWDSLKKGLLAGERLFQDLKRMEVAYLDQHKREYEITKHVSLAQLDPLALVQLRQTGTCIVSLPEVLFDLDFPGQYMRRIKSVSLSIPCVTGPYTGVSCTLTLLKSSVRHDNTLLGGNNYGRQEGDPRFTDSLGAIQSIATSSGQHDSGMFETNLRDERYLPFEGAGAISEWQIDLPAGFRQFDYDTISDGILQVGYTAREGGGLLKQKAVLELQVAVNEFIRSAGQQGLARLFSLRHEFPTEWNRFLNTVDENGYHMQTFALPQDRFPFLFQGRTITMTQVDLFGVPKTGKEVSALPDMIPPNPPGAISSPSTRLGRLLYTTLTLQQKIIVNLESDKALWKLSMSQDGIEDLDDLLIICAYTVT